MRSMNCLIALSGGLDSVVLLDLLQKQRPEFFLRAIHIHHGLHPHATQWVEHCKMLCAQWDIPLSIVYVKIKKNPGESLEAIARNARYAALAECLQPNEVLVTAHHQNDQAETFLLHAIRGAGPKGLAAMPSLKKFAAGLHWRPLLHFDRKTLHAYAIQHQLCWIEDDSNANIAFDRNFLRHEIMPRLQQRWPKVIHNLTRAAEIQAELSDFLDEQLEPYWLLITHHSQTINIHSDYRHTPSCPLTVLAHMPDTLKNWLIRAWIKKHTDVILSKKQLQLIIEEVIAARIDKNPALKIGNFILRRYAQALWVTAPCTEAMHQQHIAQCLASVSEQTHLPIDALSITFRETLAPAAIQLKQLKKLLYTLHVPPWERAHIPLIFYAEQLISIGTSVLSL